MLHHLHALIQLEGETDLGQRSRDAIDKIDRVKERLTHECERNPLSILGFVISFDALSNIALLLGSIGLTLAQAYLM